MWCKRVWEARMAEPNECRRERGNGFVLHLKWLNSVFHLVIGVKIFEWSEKPVRLDGG